MMGVQAWGFVGSRPNFEVMFLQKDNPGWPLARHPIILSKRATSKSHGHTNNGRNLTDGMQAWIFVEEALRAIQIQGRWDFGF